MTRQGQGLVEGKGPPVQPFPGVRHGRMSKKETRPSTRHLEGHIKEVALYTQATGIPPRTSQPSGGGWLAQEDRLSPGV